MGNVQGLSDLETFLVGGLGAACMVAADYLLPLLTGPLTALTNPGAASLEPPKQRSVINRAAWLLVGVSLVLISLGAVIAWVVGAPTRLQAWTLGATAEAFIRKVAPD